MLGLLLLLLWMFTCQCRVWHLLLRRMSGPGWSTSCPGPPFPSLQPLSSGPAWNAPPEHTVVMVIQPPFATVLKVRAASFSNFFISYITLIVLYTVFGNTKKKKKDWKKIKHILKTPNWSHLWSPANEKKRILLEIMTTEWFHPPFNIHWIYFSEISCNSVLVQIIQSPRQSSSVSTRTWVILSQALRESEISVKITVINQT